MSSVVPAARFGLIDRRIRGVTSRLDSLCAFVTIDSGESKGESKGGQESKGDIAIQESKGDIAIHGGCLENMGVFDSWSVGLFIWEV